jgi:peptidyl-prolyl cis-trans isomerase D
VLDDFREEQLPALLNAKTAELAAKAKAGNDLSKAAKELGATVKTSDLVGPSGQVPDLGQVAQVAPQLLDLTVGSISGPINAQRTGVVAKILDKQEPAQDEIAKNFDQTRDQMLEQKRSDAFNVFLGGIMADYKKGKRIAMNPKNAKGPQIPGE